MSLDRMGEVMHQAWLEEMARQGYHPRPFCPNTSVGSCTKCRTGLLSWADLPEEVKEVNRRGVLGLLSHLWGEEVTAEEADKLEPGCVGGLIVALQAHHASLLHSLLIAPTVTHLEAWRETEQNVGDALGAAGAPVIRLAGPAFGNESPVPLLIEGPGSFEPSSQRRAINFLWSLIAQEIGPHRAEAALKAYRGE